MCALGVSYVGGSRRYELLRDIVEVLQGLVVNEKGHRTSAEPIDLVIGGDYADWLPRPNCDCCDPSDGYKQIKSWFDPKYLWMDTNDEEDEP